MPKPLLLFLISALILSASSTALQGIYSDSQTIIFNNTQNNFQMSLRTGFNSSSLAFAGLNFMQIDSSKTEFQFSCYVSSVGSTSFLVRARNKYYQFSASIVVVYLMVSTDVFVGYFQRLDFDLDSSRVEQTAGYSPIFLSTVRAILFLREFSAENMGAELGCSTSVSVNTTTKKITVRIARSLLTPGLRVMYTCLVVNFNNLDNPDSLVLYVTDFEGYNGSALQIPSDAYPSSQSITLYLTTSMNLTKTNFSYHLAQSGIVTITGSFRYLKVQKIQFDQCLLSHTRSYNFQATGYLVNYVWKSGGSCQVCPEVLGNCRICSSYTKCASCFNSNWTLGLNEDRCVCDEASQYFSQAGGCLGCMDVIGACLSCSSNDTCVVCASPNSTKVVLLDQQVCLCNAELEYYVWGQRCVLCSDLITLCVNCESNVSYRVCVDGYFWNGSHCAQCDSNCVTCWKSSTFCLTCNSSNLRVLIGDTCGCVVPYSDCRYSGIPSCDNVTCSYLDQVEIKVESIVKSFDSNRLAIKFKLDPVFVEYDQYLEAIFQLKTGQSKNISCLNDFGTITCEFDYSSDLYLTNSTATLSLNKTGLWYLLLAPETTLNFQMVSTNNLAPNFYTSSLYQKRSKVEIFVLVILALNFFVYCVGVFFAKITVTEMMGVTQLAFFGLFMLKQNDPLVQPLYLLRYANGYNYFIEYHQQQNQPNQIYSTGHTSSTLSNINISLIFVLTPPVVALILFKIHQHSAKFKIKFQKAWKLVIGQWYITCFLFITYNYTASTISLFYSRSFSSYPFYVSLIETISLTAIFALILWLLLTKDKTWIGQYRTQFNWNPFSRRYYVFPIGQKVLVGVLITAVSQSIASSILSICVFAAGIIVVAVKKPYIEVYHNVRSIVMGAFSILILVLYTILSLRPESRVESGFTYVPYGVLAILVLNVIVGLGSTILQIVLRVKGEKAQKSCEEYLKQEEKYCFELSQEANRRMRDVRSGLSFVRQEEFRNQFQAKVATV